jgi:hypothetical protein
MPYAPERKMTIQPSMTYTHILNWGYSRVRGLLDGM